jgi:hypothetical protein
VLRGEEEVLADWRAEESPEASLELVGEELVGSEPLGEDESACEGQGAVGDDDGAGERPAEQNQPGYAEGE